MNNLKMASVSIACENVFEIDTDRELAYCATLSTAAAQCDSLHAEIIRLRTLRKARSKIDISSLQTILQPHTQEAIATANSISSQVSITIQTVASELRTMIAELKRTESELATFGELLSSCPVDAIPPSLFIATSPTDSTIPLLKFIELLEATRNQNGDVDLNSLTKFTTGFENWPGSSREPPEEEIGRAVVASGTVEARGNTTTNTTNTPTTTNTPSTPSTIQVRRSGDRARG